MKLNRCVINKSRFLIWGLTALIAGSLTISGCSKPKDTFENFESSNLRVINGFPWADNVKFYLDEFNLTRLGYINYQSVSTPSYYVVKAGTRNAAFYSEDTESKFAEKSIQLEQGKDYTLFLTGSQDNPEFILTADDLTEAPADQAKIRIANLALTGGDVRVTIQKTDIMSPKPEVTIFDGVGEKTISGYISTPVPVSKGNALFQNHTVRVYDANTNQLLTELEGVDLRATTINTIVIYGDRGGSPELYVQTLGEWLDW